MAKENLATEIPQNNPAFDRFWAQLGFPQPTAFGCSQPVSGATLVVERDILDDEPAERDDTDWQDFLGYHDEVRR